MTKFLITFLISLLVISCESPAGSYSSSKKYQGYYKIGKPYKIAGITYYPREYDSYKKQGVASWYGKKFHGKRTANNEIYNMKDFTAAHKTLPLPSIVKVKNLENGKSVIVKVNDRGPFTKNRVIDVSKRAANSLGFLEKGTTRVEVTLLKGKTKELHRKLGLK